LEELRHENAIHIVSLRESWNVTCGTNLVIHGQSGEKSDSVVFRLSVSAVNVLLAVNRRAAAPFGIADDHRKADHGRRLLTAKARGA
jgi:hypothetical protein